MRRLQRIGYSSPRGLERPPPRAGALSASRSRFRSSIHKFLVARQPLHPPTTEVTGDFLTRDFSPATSHQGFMTPTTASPRETAPRSQSSTTPPACRSRRGENALGDFGSVLRRHRRSGDRLERSPLQVGLDSRTFQIGHALTRSQHLTECGGQADGHAAVETSSTDPSAAAPTHPPPAPTHPASSTNPSRLQHRPIRLQHRPIRLQHQPVRLSTNPSASAPTHPHPAPTRPPQHQPIIAPDAATSRPATRALR